MKVDEFSPCFSQSGFFAMDADDRGIWSKSARSSPLVVDKHILDEMRLPGDFHDKPHLQPGIGIGPAIPIDDIKFLAAQLIHAERLELTPVSRRSPNIKRPLPGPPQGIAQGIVLDNELVLVFSRIFAGQQLTHRIRQITPGKTFMCRIEFMLIQQIVAKVINYSLASLTPPYLEIFFNGQTRGCR